MADTNKIYVTEEGLKKLQDEYENLVHVEARIAELEGMLKNYELSSTKGGSKTVRIGSTVKLQFVDTHEEGTYQIVGSTEADPLNGKISNETQLAQAILDKKPGQTVEVNCKKPYAVVIVSVK